LHNYSEIFIKIKNNLGRGYDEVQETKKRKEKDEKLNRLNRTI